MAKRSGDDFGFTPPPGKSQRRSAVVGRKNYKETEDDANETSDKESNVAKSPFSELSNLTKTCLSMSSDSSASCHVRLLEFLRDWIGQRKIVKNIL